VRLTVTILSRTRKAGQAPSAATEDLRPQTRGILRAVPTHSKSLSLVTKVAFLAWARAAAKQSGQCHVTLNCLQERFA
jgi:hypothetical protein